MEQINQSEHSRRSLRQRHRPEQYKRFAPVQRMEHVILLVTFTGLALTGLPQKYAAEDWAKALIQFLGGIESIRIIHHFLATLLMAEAIFHGGVISYKLFVLGRRATMIPGIRDRARRDQLDRLQSGAAQGAPASAALQLRRKSGVSGGRLGNDCHGGHRLHDVESDRHDPLPARHR